MTVCTHLDQIEVVTPSGNGCKECLELGDTWDDMVAVLHHLGAYTPPWLR